MSHLLNPFETLGTVWRIELFDEVLPETVNCIYSDIVSCLHTFNNTYSRFLSTSLISELNSRRKIKRPTPELIKLLSLGQDWYTKTNGIFNIMVEEELVRRGYDAGYSFKEKIGDSTTFPNPLIDIIINPTCITLLKGRIDLGGFGKGFAIDKIASLLKKNKLKYFLINGGGDIFATSDHEKPITIYLEHPNQPDIFIGSTTLYNEAFASSSPFKRQWKGISNKQTHLVSTSSHTATERPIASYVKAATAIEADTIATTVALSGNTTFCNNCAVATYDPATSMLEASPKFIPLETFL